MPPKPQTSLFFPALSLPYCSVSGIRPITSCLHQLEMLLAFRFLKDRIDENVAVFLLVVGERAKGGLA